MREIFLIGGGWKAETFSETYGRFLESATRGGERRIALLVAEEAGADSRAQFTRFLGAFEKVGLHSSEASAMIVSKENFPTREKLDALKPTGVFVCGGLTPAYFDALCADKKWLDYLSENDIPYCGFSAGASIASGRAIIGGWRRETENGNVQIADENAGEDLNLLDVANGLGLTDFSIDVHATEWGTLSRLIHAIDGGFSGEGWAIDENTMLEIRDDRIAVRGAGSAYHVKRDGEVIAVGIFQAGAYIALKANDDER